MKRQPAFIDCHTHTILSGHGEGSVEEVVAAAVAQGLSTVALTEHLALPSFMDSAREVSMDPRDLRSYCDAVAKAREAHPEIEVVTGMEVDWIDGNSEYEKADLSDVTFLLGSVHYIEGWAFDDPNELRAWDEREIDRVWLDYFDLWRAAVESDIPFDVMAHCDLPKKFGHRPSFDVCDYYRELARVAADNGRAIEVNTAGLRKPVNELYPSVDVLRVFHAAGVDCCVGSDAHSPAEVGYGIEAAYESLRAAGYTHVMAPTQSGGKRYIEL